MLDTEDILHISPPITEDHVAWGALVGTLWCFLALGKVASVSRNTAMGLHARTRATPLRRPPWYLGGSNTVSERPVLILGLLLFFFMPHHRQLMVVMEEHNVIRPREPEGKCGTYVPLFGGLVVGMHLQVAASEQAYVFPNAAVSG